MSAKVMSNLESVGDLVGSLKGISEGLSEDSYIESVILQAHGKATNAFDLAAAATASTGRMTHVFEFGTAGITEGNVKFADPTSPAARLWVHTISGRGGNQDIGYSFRPALNRNPQPTTRTTGVPSKYLKKLSRRKYIFWNKAFVMETGAPVEIRAKNGNFLFVPFNKEAPRNPMNRKGFVMWNSNSLGPISAVPGKTTKGEFTSFWMGWWASAGENIVEKDMRASISADIEKAVADATKKAAATVVKPVQTADIQGASHKSENWMKRIFGSRRRQDA